MFGNKNQEKDESLTNNFLKESLKENLCMLEKIFKNDETITYRKSQTKSPNELQMVLVFSDVMVEKKDIKENILQPIMSETIGKRIRKKEMIDIVKFRLLPAGEIEKTKNIDKIVESILYGDTVLLIEGIDEALIVNTKGFKSRAISESLRENAVRGPREGFTEAINTNISLIRRRIKNTYLKFEFQELGKRTKTKVAICYIDGIIDTKILKEIKKRLKKISQDDILESGYIERLIKDATFSPFKTLGYSERPDMISRKLLEGKIDIICDGTPGVLTLPFLFKEYFEVTEDNYNNYIYATINKVIRYIGLFLATSIPAIYVALITFHQEMIPTPLLLSIASARDGVPFPTIVEAIAMVVTFEVIREAGIRLPASIGQAVSIVGALVLGEAAVAAKFVSAPIVIVTAITGIGSFLIPYMLGPLLIIRIILLLLAASLGLYGYVFGYIGIIIHLMAVKSFGVPYMGKSKVRGDAL